MSARGVFLLAWIARVAWTLSSLETYNSDFVDLELVRAPIDEIIESNIDIGEQWAQPDTCAWAVCSNCSFSQKGIKLFGESIGLRWEHLAISWSQWNEFFHASGNDKNYASEPVSNMETILYWTRKPLFILPIIAIHPGHLLIDVFENLYHDMMSTYGEIRKDCIIIIDVGTQEQRESLKDMIDKIINNASMADGLGVLFKLFSKNVVYSTELLHYLHERPNILFERIHVGLSIEQSHYYYGYRFHPFGLSQYDTDLHRRSLPERYESYKQFITQESAGLRQVDRSSNRCDVLLIQKEKNRAIVNTDEMLEFLVSENKAYRVVSLESLSLQEQLQLFQECSIVVAVAGTAVHNAQFMKKSTVIILIVQPNWCNFSWMYTNQLTLLGMRHYVLCSQESETIMWGLHRKTTLQGPRFYKLADIYVDINNFSNAIKRANTDMLLERIYPAFVKSPNNMSSPRLVVSSIETQSMGSETQVSIFFDLSGFAYSMSSIFRSSPHLALCVAYWFLPDATTSCIEVHRMNYYASLRYLANEHLAFVMPTYWLQVSPEGGKLDGSILHFPADSRLSDPSLIVLQDWTIGKRILFQLALCDIRNLSLQTEWSFIDNSDLDHALHETIGSPGAVPLFQDMMSFSEQFDEYLNHFRIIRNVSEWAQVRIVEFDLTSNSRFDLQRNIPVFCEAVHMEEHNCAAFARKVFRRLYQESISQPIGLPQIQVKPTLVNPFAFLHIEKTGGTTLRDFIVSSVERVGGSYYIPCYNNVSCFNFQLPTHVPSLPFTSSNETHMDLSTLSVMAGHFFWDAWNPLFNFQPQLNVSCFVMARHPVERITSFFNQRFQNEEKSTFYKREINSFSADEWENILIYQRFARLKDDNTTVIIVDEGMSDAACRSMANIKTTTGLENPTTVDVPPELTNDQIHQALENSKQCVVGVLEQWNDTIRSINHWFPWIHFNNKFDLQLNQGSGRKRTMRPELYEVTARNNRCDMLLYEQMLKQFEAQMSVVNNSFLK